MQMFQGLKWLSSLFCSLLLACGLSFQGSIKEISKPYLGEYECTQAQYGKQDLLQDFDYIVLELKSNETYELRYKPKDQEENKETGAYSFDFEKKELSLDIFQKNIFKRKFPLKNGEIFISFRLGLKQVLLKFEQK